MQVTTTLKLKFHNLNAVKATMFAETTTACTVFGNELLAVPIKERKKLTTSKVVTPLKSALANQVIRHCKGKAGKKAKKFKLLPPEANCQNWRLFKVGDVYSVSFPTLFGIKRVPIAIKSRHWQPILDRLLANDKSLTKGTLKLCQYKGKWYALISVTEEVPKLIADNRVGVDRGQNQIAVAAPKKGFGLFFSGSQVKHIRRKFQQRRKQLQKAGKYRAVKKLEQKEQRWMRAVNNTVSRRIVDFADWQNADLILEDLSGCRQTMKQRKKSRSDNAKSRHAWAYYDLGQKLEYKMAKLGRLVHVRPPHYSSKTSSVNSVIGKRNGHWFKCTSGAKLNSDFNAARNLAIWDYRSCPVDYLKAVSAMDTDNLLDGVIGNPLNSMNIINGRAEQLCLFDTTNFETRRENPTFLASA
ncbi:transposase [Pleurocapsa sp. FMAR1]|uniref:transposase n=1 Tax=Pleurocapsa sp. FMAR1 TaxID=3040204 RepID=UPI0029C70E3C|nr:transposase [Pleurocapsa sp. FMAR1]